MDADAKAQADDVPTLTVDIGTIERLRDPRVVLAIAAGFAGMVALLLGWWGVSGTLDPGVQMSYLVSGGLGGIFLLGLAAMMLSSSNMSVARRDLTEIRGQLDVLSSRLDDLTALIETATPARNGTSRRSKARAKAGVKETAPA